jgi:hypothetical protein
MINLKFALPFILLFVHQHISNSLIGLNNPVISISFFLSFIFSLYIFLFLNEKVNNLKIFLFFITNISILLWIISPSIFKDLAFIIINFYITYYIVIQKGFVSIKKQLSLLVILSAIISIIQISGTSTMVHYFNSQYLIESSEGLIRKIETTNLFSNSIDQFFDFDSRQVRPPGVFHSSALLSGIFVLYITYIFLGFFKSIKYYALVPFLCIYSGSKLVFIVSILFFILSILFRRITVKQIVVFFIGTIFSIFSHRILFNHLMNFQFNYEIFFYSFDIRIVQYSMENLNFEFIFNLIYKAVILFVFVIMVNNYFKFIPSSFHIYNYLLISIALVASFFATPHIANLFIGWFFLPSFFFLKYLSPKNKSLIKTVNKNMKIINFDYKVISN